jgi:hypothetical protein
MACLRIFLLTVLVAVVENRALTLNLTPQQLLKEENPEIARLAHLDRGPLADHIASELQRDVRTPQEPGA